MSNRYGRILIDDNDGWEQFGMLVVKEGFNDWLTYPDMKSPFSHDWKDEDGVETDLENVFVKEKNVSLQILFVADSQVKFWENYDKLQSLLVSPRIRTIYLNEMERFFEVYYSKCSGISKPTRLRKTNKIIVGMTLHFIMPNPVLELFQELLFGSDNDTITSNGNNVLIAI